MLKFLSDSFNSITVSSVKVMVTYLGLNIFLLSSNLTDTISFILKKVSAIKTSSLFVKTKLTLIKLLNVNRKTAREIKENLF